MSEITITGKVVFKDIGTGFYGIEDNSGNHWEVMNLPRNLCQQGLKVKIVGYEVRGVSAAGWGRIIRMKRYQIVS